MAEFELKMLEPAEAAAEEEYTDVVYKKKKRLVCTHPEFELKMLEPAEAAAEEEYTERNREKLLLQTVHEKSYHKVHRKVTAKALMNYGDNPLLLAITVAKELHSRADKNEPDKHDFIKLASRVEEFTLRFLDPLKYKRVERHRFFNNPQTEFIVETAIRLKQKKFFDHPVITDFLTDRWYGVYENRKLSRLWWFLLTIWCLFDIVLFPLMFLLTRVIGKRETYIRYFKTPYFIFVRDTISYLALLALHLAICLEPSQLSFSGLEWTILCFVVGRLFTKIGQIKDIKLLKQKRDFAGKQRERVVTRLINKAIEVIKYYIRDQWIIFDLFIIIVFMCAILPLRIVTWVESDSITDNRALVIAGYLYGFNTMMLTFRVFGSILETYQGIGTIQIALSHTVWDAGLVVSHVLVITLAFASTITKVFVAGKSMVKQDSIGTPPVCNETGMQCWRKIVSYLAWSLVDLSEGLTPLKAADSVSETVAHLLYAGYRVSALILLINMLIALLSNTYQRLQDNARNEWVFQKAITVQKYRKCSPIPVPLNIMSQFGEWINSQRKKEAANGAQSFKPREPQQSVTYLLERYRLKYGDSFPPTNILEQLLDDVENTECMVNQVLYKSFTKQQGSDKALLPVGKEAWAAHEAILVDGYLITRQPYVRKFYRCGARYNKPFSSDFPHFEVMILESGETQWLGIGVVFGDCDMELMPGRKEGTVGYHTNDRKIFDTQESSKGRKTIGSTAARRGDVIRCTVMFEDKLQVAGETRVPVIFSVNGSRIVPEDRNPSYIEYSMDRPLFPYLAFEYKNSVLAKMCAREDIDFQGKDMKSNFDEVESKLDAKLDCVQQKLDAVLKMLGKKELNE